MVHNSVVTSLSWQLQLNQQLKKQIDSQIPKDLQDSTTIDSIANEAKQKAAKEKQWAESLNETLSSVGEAMKEAELVQQVAEDW